MGKTDPYVLPFYSQILNSLQNEFKKSTFNRVCLLGFDKHNNFTNKIPSTSFDFYDLSLGNWDINDKDWKIENSYDLVVCTRCPYFSKDVDSFFKNCHKLLNPGGAILVDWGLGDHWRYPEYKIGWVKNKEHESAYTEGNYLWSTIWNNIFTEHPAFKLFAQRVQKFGYEDVASAILEEVPEVYEIENEASRFNFKVYLQTYWDDQPQLYIVFSGVKI